MNFHRRGVDRERFNLDAHDLFQLQLFKTPGPIPRSWPIGSCAYKSCASVRTSSEALATCSLVPNTESRSTPAGWSDLHFRAAPASYLRCGHTVFRDFHPTNILPPKCCHSVNTP